MPDNPSIDDLIRRVRAGDQDAASELVKRYEPAIRRAVRFRLADARLGALLDSMDICQSVLGSFFIRVATGQYKLETPEQLLKLLTAMARNKLISQARKQHAQRRDTRRITSGDHDEGQFVSARPSPSNEVAVRDLLQEVERRLSPDERRMLALKNEGRDWAVNCFGAWRKCRRPAQEAFPSARPGRRATRAGCRVMIKSDDAVPDEKSREGSNASLEHDCDGPLLSLLLKHQRRAWRGGDRALGGDLPRPAADSCGPTPRRSST